MHGTLVVPNRRAQMGFTNGPRRLGDAGMYSWPPPSGYNPAPIETVGDMPQSYDVGTLASAMAGWNPEQAKKAYGAFQLVRSIRTKMSWVGKYAAYIASDPTILGQFRLAQGGDQFIASAQGMSSVAAKMDQPNLLMTLNNAVTALEVNILPSLGIGVKGRMPIVNPVDFTLSYVDTNTTGPSKVDTIDFGDLSMTSLEGDVAALKLAGEDITLQPPPGLSAALLILGIPAAILAKYLFVILLTTIIAGTVVIVTNKIFGTAKEGFNDVMRDPSWQQFIVALAKSNPEAAARLVAGQHVGGDVLGQVTDLVKWGAIGAGTILVGGTIWYFITNR